MIEKIKENEEVRISPPRCLTMKNLPYSGVSSLGGLHGRRFNTPRYLQDSSEEVSGLDYFNIAKEVFLSGTRRNQFKRSENYSKEEAR
ncbi:hypothetical protein JXM67_11175 [candidate division WOR-3 bacterium]|nr:hypothetical protein [candidate division WOR-3 bacterium]